MNLKFERIQFITSATNGLNHIDATRKACEAGVKWIQYRNKYASPAKLWEETLKIKAICKEFNAVLIINDFPNLAFEANTNGVHLGQEDVSVEEARNLIGNKFIIGSSCNNIDAIMQAQYDGANYVGLGPFNITRTKKNLNPVLGKIGFEKVMNSYLKNKLSIPVYAIGGVNADDIEFFRSIGIYGVAVSSAITESGNWNSAVKKLQEKFEADKILLNE